jgi:hypothetical protein
MEEIVTDQLIVPRQAGLLGKLPVEKVDLAPLRMYMRQGVLPPAPRSFDYSGRVANYPMAKNNKLGDCVCAGGVHSLQLAYAEIGEDFVYPGDAAVQTTYFGLTGGGDTGLVESTFLKTWNDSTFLGTQIAGFAPVNIKDKAEVASALYMFGSLFLGVEMPQSAQQQFGARQTWSVVPGSPIEGGHCVVAAGANPLGIDVITWGAVQSVTWEWWDEYTTEAYVIIPQIFVEVGHGPISDLRVLQLQQDLQLL